VGRAEVLIIISIVLSIKKISQRQQQLKPAMVLAHDF
jgi:hypothetical protein